MFFKSKFTGCVLQINVQLEFVLTTSNARQLNSLEICIVLNVYWASQFIYVSYCCLHWKQLYQRHKQLWQRWELCKFNSFFSVGQDLPLGNCSAPNCQDREQRWKYGCCGQGPVDSVSSHVFSGNLIKKEFWASQLLRSCRMCTECVALSPTPATLSIPWCTSGCCRTWCRCCHCQVLLKTSKATWEVAQVTQVKLHLQRNLLDSLRFWES